MYILNYFDYQFYNAVIIEWRANILMRGWRSTGDIKERMIRIWRRSRPLIGKLRRRLIRLNLN